MKQDAVISEAYRTGRHFQLFKEKLQDPFQEIGKLAEPAVCSNCGAVYREGRWQWASAPLDAYLTRCPACKRVHQKMPAGYVSIQGEFAHDHRDEILNLIHHLETREKAEHR